MLERRRRILRWLGASSVALVAACRPQVIQPILAAGVVMPEIQLPDLEGRPVHVSPGERAMLINFWATWCPPCRVEMAGLDRLYRKLQGRGLAVYGVSVDEDANLVREFVLRERLGFPILHDQAGRMARQRLGINAFPTTVLVRSDGRVADVVLGDRVWDRSPAEDSVRVLL